MKTSILLQNIQRLRSLLLIASVSGIVAFTAGSAYSAQIVGVYSAFTDLNDNDFNSVVYDINTLGSAPGNSGANPDMEWGLTDGRLNDYGDNDFGNFTAFDGATYGETDTLTFQGDGNSPSVLTGGYFQITLDLTGIEDIQADFTYSLDQLDDTYFPATEVELQYNTGSGFTSFGVGNSSSVFPSADGTGAKFSYDLSAISAIEDTSNVTLRWNLPDFSYSGSNNNPNVRVDNLQVYGAVIPEPSATALLLGAAFLFLAFRRRRG